MSNDSRAPVSLLLLLAICFLAFFFMIGARDLWNPDEPRYAQVAREMLEIGDWVVPHLNREVYPEKPPLYFWLIALVSRPFGDVSETTARLPSALAATLVVVITYFLGAWMLGRREGFMGAAVMATSAQFLWMGRIGTMDTLLALCILVALGLFYVGYVRKQPLLYVAGYLFLGPACLTKGPVGIVVPLVVMFAFLIMEMLLREEDAGRQFLWFSLTSTLGLTIVGLVVVPWWREAFHRSGGAYGSISILMRQTQGRMFESYSHQRPIYYYLVNGIWQFMPWTVFLPLTVLTIRREGRLRENPNLRFLLIWFLGVFFFFTLVSGKRSQYILPLFPAGGLIIGWAFANARANEGRLIGRKEFMIPLLGLLVASAVGLVALVVAAFLRSPAHVKSACVVVFVSTTVLVVLVRQFLQRPPRDALAGLVVVTAVATAIVFGFIAPVVDEYKSARPFCEHVLGSAGEKTPIYFFKKYRQNVHFYMHRHMPELDDSEGVGAALEASPRILLVMESRRRDSLVLGERYTIEEVARDKIGSRDMICLAIQSSDSPF